MASTVIRGAQIKDSTVQRHDLDTSTVGQAVVTKIVQGSGINLSSTGADSGTGDVTVTASAIPLASSTQSGLLNQTSGNTTDFIDGTNNSQPLQPAIWSVRLRSFNSVGNPTFEVDQRTVATGANTSGVFAQDRWKFYQAGTLTARAIQNSGLVVVPGTSFAITQNFLRVQLLTQQSSLGTGDYLFLSQIIEGIRLRELISGVHSLSILVRSSVANLVFSVALREASTAHSLVNLGTLGAANTWTLIPLPNLPVWTAGGTWSTSPGVAGYELDITLASGSNYIGAGGSWQTANLLAATGSGNFAASPVNSIFDIAFVQHETGALCTTPMDCPFSQNLLECQRYYQTSYPWGTAKGTATASGSVSILTTAGTWPQGWIPFSQRMARSLSSLNGFSPSTGTLNTVRDSQANTDRSTSGTINASDNGFSGFSLSSTNASGSMYLFHYLADTGW